MNKWKTAITAMCCITAVMFKAMDMGIDGVMLAAGVGAIAGLGGYFVPHKQPPQP